MVLPDGPARDRAGRPGRACDASVVEAALECVVNVSEGRDEAVLSGLREAAGDTLLDTHSDPHHHRTVLTLGSTDAAAVEESARAVARVAVARIDLRAHRGAHPRIGVIDVVPFVPLGAMPMARAVAAREAFGAWAAAVLALPGFRYGAERSLPEVRRDAFRTLRPDWGPTTPHPTAGAVAVGARGALVAYNVWLDGATAADARAVAAAVRGPELRSLGLDVGGVAQVSMNLVAPDVVGPAEAFDRVRTAAAARGIGVRGAELVGLVPAAVLRQVPSARWPALDLGAERTIEARLSGR